MRLLVLLFLFVASGFGVYWLATAPETVDTAQTTALPADPERGEVVFNAAGCASCHKAKDAEGDARLVLTGGQKFPSPFGNFTAPNISSDPDHGIGGWTQDQFVNAVIKGVSPQGAHYFPAFPYSSYNKMTLEDAAALWSYMQTLPADATPSAPHEVGFPFNIRRNLGGWKLLFLKDDFYLQDAADPVLARGRYLVEALGHCAECHTERNALGGLNHARWMGGAPDPSGKGRVPAIDPGSLFWDEAEIAEYLSSGFTPEFDTAGGHMVDVIENTAKLTDEDRAAIAAYLKAIPEVARPVPEG